MKKYTLAVCLTAAAFAATHAEAGTRCYKNQGVLVFVPGVGLPQAVNPSVESGASGAWLATLLAALGL